MATIKCYLQYFIRNFVIEYRLGVLTKVFRVYMKLTAKHIFSVLLLLSFAVSCKKDTPQTQSSRLLGKWMEVQYATDDNNNGIIDPSEIHNVAKGYTAYMIFNKDSSGLETVKTNDSTQQLPFTWEYLEGDSLQWNGIGHDSLIYAITNISEIAMTLELGTNYGYVWYFYNKQ